MHGHTTFFYTDVIPVLILLASFILYFLAIPKLVDREVSLATKGLVIAATLAVILLVPLANLLAKLLLIGILGLGLVVAQLGVRGRDWKKYPFLRWGTVFALIFLISTLEDQGDLSKNTTVLIFLIMTIVLLSSPWERYKLGRPSAAADEVKN